MPETPQQSVSGYTFCAAPTQASIPGGFPDALVWPQITQGRRNWLFTYPERAGYRAAAIQSLLSTAKLNRLEPYAWLKDTLKKDANRALYPDC